MRLIVVSDWPLFRLGIQRAVHQQFPDLPVIEVDSIFELRQRFRDGRYGYRDMFVIDHNSRDAESCALDLMSYREKCLSISRDQGQYCVVSSLSDQSNGTWIELIRLLTTSSNTNATIDYDADFSRDKLKALTQSRHEPGINLTKAEQKIFRALAQGMRNTEIAESLHISVSTVKTHITRMFRKTGTSSRTQLVIRLSNSFAGPVSAVA